MAAKPCIGIDPAFRTDGFCVCVIDTDKTVRFLMFKDGLLSFMSWLLYDSPEAAYCCVENSNLQNSTFAVTAMLTRIRGAMAAPVVRNMVLQASKISRNVGANQAASQYTYDICRLRWGTSAYEVSPREKGAKKTHAQVALIARSYGHIFGKEYRAGKQDMRDAYMLALLAEQFSKKPVRKTG